MVLDLVLLCLGHLVRPFRVRGLGFLGHQPATALPEDEPVPHHGIRRLECL
jgi:hypothetical protein